MAALLAVLFFFSIGDNGNLGARTALTISLILCVVVAVLFIRNVDMGGKLPAVLISSLLAVILWGALVQVYAETDMGWIQATQARWLLAMVVLYLVVKKPQLYFIIPALLLHVSHAIKQGIDLDITRAVGISFSSTTAAATLGIGAIYVITVPRLRWLAPFFLLAIGFTGARSITIVVAILVAGMLWHRLVTKRQVIVILLVTLAVAAPFWQNIQYAYRLRGSPSEVAVKQITDTQLRYDYVGVPSLFPQPTPPGTTLHHNTPYRIALETGILSALLWLSLIALSLWKKPRLTISWWLMLALLLMGQFDGFIWHPLHLSLLWWVLLAYRLKGEAIYESAERDALEHIRHQAWPRQPYRERSYLLPEWAHRISGNEPADNAPLQGEGELARHSHSR